MLNLGFEVNFLEVLNMSNVGFQRWEQKPQGLAIFVMYHGFVAGASGFLFSHTALKFTLFLVCFLTEQSTISIQ